ncbi:MAG: hypothetical protein WCY97_10270 [Methanothrix sp.]|jgi:hypothetical protein|uniref:Uncharacterized protein n=1 Tax=Methanothrix harundinacea TaxID=301375 RepID=A0A101FSM6_9EURY|nr:MAG: Uncharacterized protein XD72_2004 [Methanothrix harundinacea]MDD2639048.1 hypothetical protein [Methanothrix sp.]MDI9398699.1 hypothetical protein [Euryarchaeota archaeon]KUK94541.1 MAG: Uncharacterized protein XE07_2116 [Methanothrix harundinacea]MCP1392254.1 hypothetical protein [Methanothrix harundinacea]
MQQNSFDVKDLRRLENVVSKRTGFRINCDSVSPPILSLLADVFEEEARLSYRDLMEIVAEFLCSSSYSRREIRVLMMRLGVDDSDMQADLIYMARSWRNRDPFTYVLAHR